jgi:ATP-dependent DNA helicase RecQ
VSRAAHDSWDGVDRGLFEALREWRRRQAVEREIAPFIVMGDATLRDLARARPSTLPRLRAAHGIGEKKCAEYGADLLAEIARYCRQAGVGQDVDPAPATPVATARRSKERPPGGARLKAFELFAKGQSFADVRQATGRAASTVIEYLVDYIEREGRQNPEPWVDASLFGRIRSAAERLETGRLKPIFEALDGTVEFDQIRIALACLRNSGSVVAAGSSSLSSPAGDESNEY